MKRHNLDLTSLVSGAIFVAVGTIYLLDLTSDYAVQPRWVAAFVLIGVGLAGLLSTVNAGRRWDATAGVTAHTGDTGADNPAENPADLPVDYSTRPAERATETVEPTDS